MTNGRAVRYRHLAMAERDPDRMRLHKNPRMKQGDIKFPPSGAPERAISIDEGYTRLRHGVPRQLSIAAIWLASGGTYGIEEFADFEL